VTDAELERQRKLLHEAFRAGWQAALAVKVTSSPALAVIESCFDLWLEEEVDERGVFGLPFRRRYDLPRPKRLRVPLVRSGAVDPVEALARRQPARPGPVSAGSPLGGPAPVGSSRTAPRHRVEPVGARPPVQRQSPENASHDGQPHGSQAHDSGKVRTGS
jgi:hypothetical protein